MFRRIYESLIGQFVKRTGRQPEGMDLLKLKLQAQEEARQAEKILPFTPRPESPFGKPGGWMPSDEEVKGIMSNLTKGKTKPGKINYEEMQKQFPDVKLFGNESFDELLEIEKTGIHPRKNKSRLLTDDEIEDYEEILGDSETWMDKGTVEEAEAAVKRQKDYEQQMYSEYQVEKQGRKELEDAYKEIDFRMTGEDTKYEANELADMIAETRFKTEMSDLPQNTQLDLYDEAYNYLMELKRDAANFKGAVNVKTGKNIVTGEQEFPIDPMTGKPRKPNAKGGRIKLKKGGLSHILGV